jgi:hypothetical protein
MSGARDVVVFGVSSRSSHPAHGQLLRGFDEEA